MQENAKYYILKVQHFVVVITKVTVKTEGQINKNPKACSCIQPALSIFPV